MRSSLFLALCVALFGLFATHTMAADLCLGIPLNTKTTTCGVIPCPYGSYCDDLAACVPTKVVGTACEDDDECEFGTFCRGVAPSKSCVAIAGPGQTCTGDEDIAQPDCYGNLYCDPTSKKCLSGVFGDGCTADEHCLNEKCTNGACDGSAGVTCSSTQSCSPANYCDGTTGTCKARLTAGSSCYLGECVQGTQCIKTADDQSYLNVTCVADKSIAPGSYCDDNSAVCESGPCQNNYCLTEPPAYCEEDSECNSGTLCLCQGGYKLAGLGKCAKFSCLSVMATFSECLSTNCGTGSNGNSIAYPNSCPSLHCKEQYTAAIDCNPLYFGAT